MAPPIAPTNAETAPELPMPDALNPTPFESATTTGLVFTHG